MMINYFSRIYKKSSQKSRKGFTLIEISLVLLIIGLLLLIMIPNLSQQKQLAERRTDEAFVANMNTQVALYQDEDQETPVSWASLVKAGLISAKQQTKAEQMKLVIQVDEGGGYHVDIGKTE
ncbi:prepilin-type N-terminal cleavage/methylation domain-containing protein [Lapidilactobacillus luobeiensis]|uniref:prepilin-type N-terminal cleavage/methylation domain-containing protein n=1 Tax=Lapidilactobacillus luobeiensis TaxID=2950371 RepID=UPI0021C49B15|nr:prepilin-type N-terminal cleavage/methylation domain-containing protein [Lapidilactobacillus luobeiensis]